MNGTKISGIMNGTKISGIEHGVQFHMGKWLETA